MIHKNIFKSKELDKNQVTEESSVTATDGRKYIKENPLKWELDRNNNTFNS